MKYFDKYELVSRMMTFDEWQSFTGRHCKCGTVSSGVIQYKGVEQPLCDKHAWRALKIIKQGKWINYRQSSFRIYEVKVRKFSTNHL